MAKLNRTCVICRKKYSYCPTCASDVNKPAWMAVFCCENCRDLYNIINDYRYKLLLKKDAFYKLNSLNLSCANHLPENFQKILNEILSEKYTKEIQDNSNEQKETIIKEKIVETEFNTERIKKERTKKAKEKYKKKDILKIMNSESD